VSVVGTADVPAADVEAEASVTVGDGALDAVCAAGSLGGSGEGCRTPLVVGCPVEMERWLPSASM
jgi:hypothetical protein